MKILAIEDDKIKIDELRLLIGNEDLVIRESFQSGLSELRNNIYDLLILDMTIPLWDRENNDISQHYEQLGGEKLLREMQRKKLHLPTILFTMFDKFSLENEIITFDQINEKYKSKYHFYVGGIFYDSIQDNWKEELLSLIKTFHES